MARYQTTLVLSVLKAAYSHAFQNMSKADGEAMLNLWATMFQEESYEEVNAAVTSLIATRTVGYSPAIGEVKEQIRKLHHTNDIDDAYAWALVSKASRNGSYHSVEEFNKLPPNVQRAVGSPEQLKQWAGMDADVVESVVASNFKKTFRAQAERDAEMEKIPSQVRNYIGSYADNFKMIGD